MFYYVGLGPPDDTQGVKQSVGVCNCVLFLFMFIIYTVYIYILSIQYIYYLLIRTSVQMPPYNQISIKERSIKSVVLFCH